MRTQEKYTIANKRKIYYEFIDRDKLSDKTPLIIFLHEGLGSIPQWKDFPDMLCAKLNLPGLLYDRYGYGKSEALHEPRKLDYFNIEAFESLPALLRNLNIKNKLILFGHSDGATIAILFASKFQQRTVCIISEAAHVIYELVSVEGILETVKTFENGKLKELLHKFHGDKTESMFYGWSDVLLSSDFRQWSIEQILQGITVPVLVIQGGMDEYGSYEQVESIMNNVKGFSEFLLIENCGHIPHLQAILAKDVAAAHEGDPASKYYDEIIFSYPGLFAVTVY